MKPDWFLIANASRARIARREADGRIVVAVTLQHPDSRLHSAQLGADKAGREMNDRGFGGAAFEPRVDAQHKEHQLFAKELAGMLEEHARDGAFRRLEVFASLPFLGLLEQAFGAATRERLGAAHPVDLTGVGPAELAQRIDHEIGLAAEKGG